MINRDNYDKVQSAFQGTAITPWGKFDGDFTHFDEKRQRYFALHSESMKYYRSMASNVSYLPESWRPMIEKCIADTLQRGATGLNYVRINTTPKRFRLELKYTSTEKNYQGPYVFSSELVGGYVVDADGHHRYSLYRPCSDPPGPESCPDNNSRSEFVVFRDDPNEPVTVTLNLDANHTTYSTSFDVDYVAKKVDCKKTYEGSERQTTIIGKVPLRLTTVTYDSKWTVWVARAIAPGRVTAVTDWAISDPRDMNFLNWNAWDKATTVTQAVQQLYPEVDVTSNPYYKDDVVYIVGTQGGGPSGKTMDITVEYQDPTSDCKEIDWKP